QALDDLVAVGFLSTEARVGAEELCWSTVHGFASLVLAGHVQVADLADHLDRLLGAVDRSLGASTDRADRAAT
ncbi:TetR-like C-terminal domain-containing protein, partial [Nocardioides kribbensis]